MAMCVIAVVGTRHASASRRAESTPRRRLAGVTSSFLLTPAAWCPTLFDAGDPEESEEKVPTEMTGRVPHQTGPIFRDEGFEVDLLVEKMTFLRSEKNRWELPAWRVNKLSAGYPTYQWTFRFHAPGRLEAERVRDAYMWANHYEVAPRYAVADPKGNSILMSAKLDKETVLQRDDGSKASRRTFKPITTLALTMDQTTHGLYEDPASVWIRATVDDFLGGYLLAGNFYVQFRQVDPQTVEMTEYWGTKDRRLMRGLAAYITPHDQIIRGLVQNLAYQLAADLTLPAGTSRLSAAGMEGRHQTRLARKDHAVRFSGL
jgi:3',5'-cyclic AMP phosphodiesterase CpdA